MMMPKYQQPRRKLRQQAMIRSSRELAPGTQSNRRNDLKSNIPPPLVQVWRNTDV